MNENYESKGSICFVGTNSRRGRFTDIRLLSLAAEEAFSLDSATITLDPATTYQTITGWEAVSQAGQLRM